MISTLAITRFVSILGIAELFSTPVNAKQRRSSRVDGSKAGTPKSTVEMSVMQTPEEAGELELV